jgi:hypothetical protein
MIKQRLPKNYPNYAHIAIPTNLFLPYSSNKIFLRAEVFYIVNLEKDSQFNSAMTKMVCVTDMKEVPHSLKRLEQSCGSSGEIKIYHSNNRELVLLNPSAWNEKYTKTFSKKDNVDFLVSNRKILKGNPDSLRSKYDISVPLDENKARENDIKFFLDYMICKNSLAA